MKGAVLYGPRDVRFVERADPKIVDATDVILRLSATCVCGSDLWRYRGIDSPRYPAPMGHEYCGVVEEIGRDVTHVKKRQFVVGSFFASAVFDVDRDDSAFARLALESVERRADDVLWLRYRVSTPSA